MKLTRLGNTTQRPVTAGGVWPHPADGERVRRVEALDASESDRQRSLQQEMAEIEAEAIADFAGGDKILQDARAVAEQLAALGAAVDELIKPAALAVGLRGVDDQA